MSEIAITFGSDRHLVGTLALPGAGVNAPGGVAVLLLNAGVIHRIGPHRFNVKLARELARRGLVSLRLDLSGQGDSRQPSSPLPYERQAVADLQAAMDHVQRLCGIERFVIAGICSGAQNGLAAAEADPRVTGLWLLDAYMYPTPRTRWVRYRLQLQSRWFATLMSWTQSAIKFGAQRLRSLLSPATLPQPRVDYGHRAPSRAAFADLLNRLTQRGVKIHMTYTGSMLWNYNYPEQLRDAFAGEAFLDHVQCDFLPEVDHTATLLASQRRLTALLCDWLERVRP